MNQKELGLSIPDLRHRAESGSAVAQTILGICYLEGVQVEVDHQEAFRLLSAAANQGAPRAMAKSGLHVRRGTGDHEEEPAGGPSALRARSGSGRVPGPSQTGAHVCTRSGRRGRPSDGPEVVRGSSGAGSQRGRLRGAARGEGV